MCSDLLIIQMLFDFFVHARFVCVIIIKWCCALIIFIDSLFGHFFLFVHCCCCHSMFTIYTIDLNKIHERKWRKMKWKKRGADTYTSATSQIACLLWAHLKFFWTPFVSLCVSEFSTFIHRKLFCDEWSRT